ncbi:MAG: response regulator [Verrucomicrobiia bacterium]|jgi:heavy metal response regulator
MRILVVEDEKKIQSFIRKGLTEQGYVVDVSSDGNEGLILAETRPYDAIVLDIMLPGRDGLSILRLLRKKKNKVPVIIITARSDVSERIEGLDLGADDYLVKPFYLEELIARLKSILRRSAGEGLSILEIKDLRLNLMTHTASRGGVDIELAPREFEVLELLMRTPGRVLSRTQIIEQVWEYHFDPDTNLVDVYIRRLRKKIDHEFDDKLIQTVRGIGYTLSAK